MHPSRESAVCQPSRLPPSPPAVRWTDFLTRALRQHDTNRNRGEGGVRSCRRRFPPRDASGRARVALPSPEHTRTMPARSPPVEGAAGVVAAEALAAASRALRARTTCGESCSLGILSLRTSTCFCSSTGDGGFKLNSPSRSSGFCFFFFYQHVSPLLHTAVARRWGCGAAVQSRPRQIACLALPQLLKLASRIRLSLVFSP